MTDSRIEGRIRIAALLALLGLAIEALTLFWDRPLAFVFFSALSPLLVLGGVALFLLSLIQGER